MTYANRLMVVSIAIAILAFLMPIEMVAAYNYPQETDVAIVRQHFYFENGIVQQKTETRRSPTYHDLVITPTQTEVIFHNYVEIHDERVESTQYFIEFKITVTEEIDGDTYFVDEKVTGNVFYSPPNQIYHYQSIYVSVDYTGTEYHNLQVVTDITHYEIKSDNSLKLIQSGGYGCNAFVYEVDDLDEIIGG